MSLDKGELKKIIEAAIFAADRPLNVDRLKQLFQEEERPSGQEIKEQLTQLVADYENRGIALIEVASGYQFQVRELVGPWVGRLWEEKPARYSKALLETIALIAYRQPVTRGEIEEVRGVSVSTHIIKTLLERGWVCVVGQKDVPGRPSMYATTRGFLDYFGLKNLKDLPSMAEIKDLDSLDAIAPGKPELPQQELPLPESSEDTAVDTVSVGEAGGDVSVAQCNAQGTEEALLTDRADASAGTVGEPEAAHQEPTNESRTDGSEAVEELEKAGQVGVADEAEAG